MPKIEAFKKHVGEYEQWFDDNPFAYEAELRAVRSLLPQRRDGIEVGVGTGRFASRLGVDLGVEPSGSMSEIAGQRGITLVGGVAESLPFKDASFGYVLMVTTVCFLDDMEQAFREACRVLSDDGALVVGLVDRNSPIGKEYLKYKDESVFYREATFYSTDEVVKVMAETGFVDPEFRQTIFADLGLVKEDEPVESGYGKGSFVVISARKKHIYEQIR